ncbi:hypothetical protein CDD80_2047 [Ophiocordyceps camponoti-rufipedis]|uniref:SPT23/MGA2-like DNA-binding domain-containing protein n=1 Tax=Ophiocordyceps camponoti-rufipedis TaxID=2004952 RepID=A0A2C5YCK8_9HYPO|nr:hypothetical protein CDD80_2047 [Ophiocordyceps camponoti-rufipedis]
MANNGLPNFPLDAVNGVDNSNITDTINPALLAIVPDNSQGDRQGTDQRLHVANYDLALQVNQEPSPLRPEALDQSLVWGPFHAPPSLLPPFPLSPPLFAPSVPVPVLEAPARFAGVDTDAIVQSWEPASFEGLGEAAGVVAPENGGSQLGFQQQQQNQQQQQQQQQLQQQPSPPPPSNFTIQMRHKRMRAEKQVPITMIMAHLPKGITKMRLPEHTVWAFKHRRQTPPSPDTLDLSVLLIRASAVGSPAGLDRVFSRAASASSDDGRDDDLRICPQCAGRDAKRIARKTRKAAGEEAWHQVVAPRRIITFHDAQINDLVHGTDGALMQLKMRIGCYSRHHHEHEGFRVVFTLKDWQGNLVHQAMTHTFLTADDHRSCPARARKTAAPVPAPAPAPGFITPPMTLTPSPPVPRAVASVSDNEDDKALWKELFGLEDD